MKKSVKTIFSCQSCGYQSPKWLGKCPDCGGWDGFVEERQATGARAVTRNAAVAPSTPVPIDSIEIDHEQRLLTTIHEFDRVLGGGLVPGTLILIGGDPGIGKSTLMLQALHGLAGQGRKVLYVSGEESIRQIRLRSKRLETVSSTCWWSPRWRWTRFWRWSIPSSPRWWSSTRSRPCSAASWARPPAASARCARRPSRLMLMAKRSGIPTFLVGHVTKDGAIAGPKLLEHMVDTVLYFEGDRNHIFRVLRAVKNRFGSTNEIGVFEMKGHGLEEVANPSAVFLSGRPASAAGSVVAASMEGTRPILVELQALTSGTNFGTPRRTILGLDPNRVALLAAVMEKKIGMHLMGYDIFMNVAGGVRVIEPAVDLAIVAAIASSFLDKPVPDRTVVMGEVGLTGEVRAIGQADTRIYESAKMGFNRCIVPQSNLKRLPAMEGVEIAGVSTVSEAVESLF